MDDLVIKIKKARKVVEELIRLPLEIGTLVAVIKLIVRD